MAKHREILSTPSQGDDIRKIHYFTAPIVGTARPNQDVYLRALATLPLVNVVLGKFKKKRVQCSVSACAHIGGKMFDTVEEKRTDVNVGIHMLDDAYQNRCDTLVLVSGDSDLVPALNMIKARFPSKTLIVYMPTRNPIRGAAVELRSAADKDRSLPLNLLPRTQFPPQIPDGTGGVITKPVSW
jgi:6-hydroxy-3-succinoylpyridine 3-monooxygenase